MYFESSIVSFSKEQILPADQSLKPTEARSLGCLALHHHVPDPGHSVGMWDMFSERMSECIQQTEM